MKKSMDKKGDKNIFLLGFSSLFNDIGSEMVTPILPFLITSLGGAGFAVGLLSGLKEGLSSLFKLLGGYVSDKTGKRMPFVFLGHLISIISKYLLSLVSGVVHIVTLVSFERFGKIRDAPRDVIIASSTNRQGRGFGIHQMLDTSGAIIGSLIVLFLFWKFSLGFKPIILIAALISSFSLIPLFFVKTKKSKPEKVNLFSGIKNLKKELKYFIFVSAIFTLANFGLYMFLILRAKELTGSVVIPLSLYVLFNIIWATFTIPFGKLSDRLGRKKVLMSGYILFLLVTLGFLFDYGLVYLGFLFVAYGFVYAITQSNQKALVSDLAPKLKGTALGFYYAVIGTITIPAGIIAGLLWDISNRIMFGYMAIIALISIILLSFLKE